MIRRLFASALAIAAAALTLQAAPASAGHGEARPWFRQQPWQNTGPGLYYAYHYDHVPGYPVPIYRNYNRPSYHGASHHRQVIRYAVSAHVQWCSSRYRSYRASDNTFQPYHGGRRQCWSPY
jgi:hypothetical protein